MGIPEELRFPSLVSRCLWDKHFRDNCIAKPSGEGRDDMVEE